MALASRLGPLHAALDLVLTRTCAACNLPGEVICAACRQDLAALALGNADFAAGGGEQANLCWAENSTGTHCNVTGLDVIAFTADEVTGTHWTVRGHAAAATVGPLKGQNRVSQGR